jgi:2-oxoglutarate ferredoxin oxidoreductase subunit beta
MLNDNTDSRYEPMSTAPDRWLRKEHLPHIWCPGCGIGTILRQVIEQFTKLGWRNDEVVFVTGIGCTGRASGYVNAQTLHTIHGRALPTATGIKMARPDMHVVAMLGDGDGVGIGGNHFIHAAKRNIGITAIVVNNRIYGMTGGQVSPTTPQGSKSTTSPYGNVEPAMDVCKLALGAGATFVARVHTANPVYVGQIIGRALQHEGFSVVEVLSQCPTYFGRFNGMPDPVQMVQWFKTNTFMAKSPDEEKDGKIPIGVFRDDKSVPELSMSYRNLWGAKQS